MEIKEEIELLKSKLNSATNANKGLCTEEIIQLSQKLDRLIVKYYKEMLLSPSKKKKILNL